VNCNTVHFGYAIPVSVVPLPEEPELAELVLDPTPDLTPEAVSYLLRHHPQLRQENDGCQGSQDLNGGNSNIKMAATAKHEHLRGTDGGKFVAEPEEDIAAIAKQISDHAEAIYQTWKSRGLAPAEILTCHSNATAADKFGSALTPQPSQALAHQPKSSPVKSSLQTKLSPVKTPSKSSAVKSSQQASPVAVDLLASAPSMDANNLEQLVNNFVVEDKARLAAARQQQKSSPAKPLPSSIQFALQKFEKQVSSNIQQPGSKSPPSSSFIKTAGSHLEIKSQSSQTKSPTVGTYTSHLTRSSTASACPSTSQQLTPNKKSSIPVHHHGSIKMDTIETTFPQDVPQQPKRPTADTSSETTSVSPASSSSGLTTWPLKNKSVTISGGNDRRSAGNAVSSAGSDVSSNRKDDATSSTGKYATLPSNKCNNNTKDAVAYLDEVAREEERLINALKTGIIIAEDPTKVISPGSKVSEKKTSGILQKKSPAKDNKVSSVAKKTKKQQPAEIVTPKFSVTATGAQTKKSPEVSGTVTPISSPTISTLAPPSLPQSFASSLSSADPESPKSQQNQSLPASSSKDELDKSSLSSLSVVDYAKVRYRAAQQNPLTQQRLEDVKQFEQQRSITGIASVSGGTSADSKHLHHNEVIPVARNRFQVSPRSTGTDGSTSPTTPAENWSTEWLPGGRVGVEDEAAHVRRRIGTPSTNLARPVRHPPVDSHPPHQENAIQPRLRTAGTVSGTNPVRPFLTRGSVAERVLIFEKCPSELLLEKRSRGAPAITTWRSGHDVHTKAQVRNISYYKRVYPKVSGLAAWSENCKWYSSLPLGVVVSLFYESV
jgi:serine/threonine-protein phosphatase 2A regulatory subunit B''